MPIILSGNGVQLNYNAGSTPNAGVRLFCIGDAVPGTNTFQNIIRFTNSGGASNFGISLRWYIGAGRQSGTFAENWWTCYYAGFNSNGTTWTQNFNSGRWYFEGNGITSEQVITSGNYIQCQVSQSDTGAYVESYLEVYCSRWDQITVSY
jgi:hypothetical protein